MLPPLVSSSLFRSASLESVAAILPSIRTTNKSARATESKGKGASVKRSWTVACPEGALSLSSHALNISALAASAIGASMVRARRILWVIDII